MDEDGWKSLRPFLKEHTRSSVTRCWPETEATAERYGCAESLPDSFLIDKRGNLVGKLTAEWSILPHWTRGFERCWEGDDR